MHGAAAVGRSHIALMLNGGLPSDRHLEHAFQHQDEHEAKVAKVGRWPSVAMSQLLLHHRRLDACYSMKLTTAEQGRMTDGGRCGLSGRAWVFLLCRHFRPC